MNATQLKTPAGTYGLMVEPWSKGEIYAVAANWAQASAPVLIYDRDGGWSHSGRQVADYRHSPEAALRAQIVEAIALSEGTSSDEVDDDEAATHVAGAVRIDDSAADEDEE